MPICDAPAFREYLVDDLTIEDEESFRHVALYDDLKQVLRGTDYRFRVLPASLAGRWERALLLNLTFWGARGGGDVLADRQLPADVLAHVAWHHLADKAVGGEPGAASTPGALFLGEAIASAFDLYLVGRLLGHSPDSSFLETQVPAMAEAAEAAGRTAEDFGRMLEDIARDPAGAFAGLRELLFDAATALFAADTPETGLAALARLDGHRFAFLLHHYELSNWVLYARAYGRTAATGEARVREVDSALRSAPVALDWLVYEWVAPPSAR
ncbi:MAG: hypothetical protein ABR538_08520 [Candidatus Binatia bacterium]